MYIVISHNTQSFEWKKTLKFVDVVSNKQTNKKSADCFAASYMQQILVSQIKCRCMWAEQTLNEMTWGLIFWGKASSCTPYPLPPPILLKTISFASFGRVNQQHPPTHHAGWLLCPLETLFPLLYSYASAN